MDNKSKFKKLVSLLKKSSDVLSDKCLDDLNSKDIQVKVYSKYFHKSRQLDVLRKRVKSMELEENNIIGVSEVIDSLEEYSSEKITIIKAANKNKTYTFIMDVDYNVLIGFFVNKKMNIIRLLSLQDEYMEKGYPQIDRWYLPNSNVG